MGIIDRRLTNIEHLHGNNIKTNNTVRYIRGVYGKGKAIKRPIA